MELQNIENLSEEDSLFYNELDLVSKSMTNNISLRKIYFDDNKINHLTISFLNSKILKKVRFYNCSLDDEKASLIFSAIIEVKTIENIDLTHNFIKDQSLNVLCESIEGLTKLKRLNFLKNNIDDDGINIIGKILEKGKRIIELNLGNNKFSEYGIIHGLSRPLGKNHSLEILNLSYNCLSPDSIKAIVDNIISKKNKSNIKQLILIKCKINDKCCIHLGNLLRANTKLEELNLNENLISSKGLYFISEGLKHNMHIRSIYFDHNYFIGDTGILHYTYALKFNKSIKDLFLKNLLFGNLSFQNISECLSDQNNNILNLHLSNNFITNKGIELICNGIKGNKKLRSLSFDSSGLKDNGLCLLFKCLIEEKGSKIYFLSIEGNQLEFESAYWVSELIRINKNIKNLVLKSCKIKDLSAKLIFKSIGKDSEVHIIDMSCNEITDESADELAKSLEENTKLNYLHLNGNLFTDVGLHKLNLGLKNNKYFDLKVVDMSDMNISNNLIEEMEDLINQRREEKEFEEITDKQLVKVQIFK